MIMKDPRLILVSSIMALTLGLVVTGCAATLANSPTPTFAPPPTPEAPSSLFVVERRDIAETLQARGRVVSLNEQALLFPMGGSIKTLNVQAGSQVEEKDLIVELDVPQLAEQVEKAEFELNTSLLNLKALEATENESHELWIQRSKLWEEYYQIQRESAITENQRRLVEIQKRIAEMDTAIKASEQRQTQFLVDRAKLEVEYRKQVLTRSNENLARTQLRAPFGGVVISLDVRPGDKIAPFEAFGVLADPDRLEIEASILETEMGRVGLEQPANIVLDAFPLAGYKGKVRQIGSKPILWQGKRAFPVNIAFDPGQKPPRAIRMGADVVISSKISAKALVVPTRAIYTDGNAKFVEVIKEGRSTRVRIETGISNKEHTEIIAGLNEGAVLRLPQ